MTTITLGGFYALQTSRKKCLKQWLFHHTLSVICTKATFALLQENLRELFSILLPVIQDVTFLVPLFLSNYIPVQSPLIHSRFLPNLQSRSFFFGRDLCDINNPLIRCIDPLFYVWFGSRKIKFKI